MSTRSSKSGLAPAEPLPKDARHNIVDALLPLAYPLAQLRPAKRNARQHPADNLREIKASLREFGQDVPLVANRRTGEVLKGNGRLQSGKELGWTHMAVVWVDDDEPKAIARAIADNAAALSSVWDEEMLAELLEEAEADDADVRRLLADIDLEFDPDSIEQADDDDEAGLDNERYARVPELEIRPEEHYDFVMVMSENVHEWNRLCSLLGLTQQVVSRKGRMKIGLARAVKAKQLLALIDGESQADE